MPGKHASKTGRTISRAERFDVDWLYHCRKVFFPIRKKITAPSVCNWLNSSIMQNASMPHRNAILSSPKARVFRRSRPLPGRPVLLRAVNETPERGRAGNAKSTGTGTKKILDERIRLLENASDYQACAAMCAPCGDGKAYEWAYAFQCEEN